MPTLTIDGKTVTVEAGQTILEAAAKLGIEIPTLCYLKEIGACTSCMVCLVKVKGQRRLLPSCATVAVDGMEVQSESEEVRIARRTALELLLGDHLGDCEAPCEGSAPGGLDIPKVLRLVAKREFDSAAKMLRETVPLAGLVAAACSAPYEKACRRGQIDSPVGIRNILRFLASRSINRSNSVQTPNKNEGSEIMVSGANLAAMTSAFFLQKMGYQVTLIYKGEKESSDLEDWGAENNIPANVIEQELSALKNSGVSFRNADRISASGSKPFAVAIISNDLPNDIGCKVFELNGDFKVPQVVNAAKLVAAEVDNYLRGEKENLNVSGKRLSTHVGKLLEGEAAEFLQEASSEPSTQMTGNMFTEEEAAKEAARCLHCDCRKKDDCRLRKTAEKYNARPTAHRTGRRKFTQDRSHPEIIYEKGKCIACGICVRLCEGENNCPGLGNSGRGFAMRIDTPFGESIRDAIKSEALARKIVDSCPTGAFSFRD